MGCNSQHPMHEWAYSFALAGGLSLACTAMPNLYTPSRLPYLAVFGKNVLQSLVGYFLGAVGDVHINVSELIGGRRQRWSQVMDTPHVVTFGASYGHHLDATLPTTVRDVYVQTTCAQTEGVCANVQAASSPPSKQRRVIVMGETYMFLTIRRLDMIRSDTRLCLVPFAERSEQLLSSSTDTS